MIHLHVRSWFSFLAGGSSPEDLVQTTQQLEQPALAGVGRPKLGSAPGARLVLLNGKPTAPPRVRNFVTGRPTKRAPRLTNQWLGTAAPPPLSRNPIAQTAG